MVGTANRLGRGFGVCRYLISTVALFVFALAVPGTVLGQCAGDCNNDNDVAVDELITGVNIALGQEGVVSCSSFDINDDQKVSVDELIGAVTNALDGCPAFVIGSHTCTFAPDSKVAISTQALPLPENPALGAVKIDCGAVAPDTGAASCDCTLQSFEPINLIGIGYICFTAGGACPAGQIDCDGGNLLDVTMDSDHNIGTCTAKADCETQCAAYCAPDSAFFSGCEGFCIGGTNDAMACGADSDCPSGSCPGKDADAQHTGVCQCDCLRIGGAPSGSGGLQCNLSVNINVEINPPCADGDVLIAVGTRCIPLTTEKITSQVHDANNTPGKNFPEPAFTATGESVECAGLANSVTTGLKLVGSVNFADSTIGDLTTSESITCQ